MSADLNASEPDRLYPFLSEVAQMRRRTRHYLTAAEAADAEAVRPIVLHLLTEALATELICFARYQQHAELAGAALAGLMRAELLKYAQEERGHAAQLAECIRQLGGQPDLRAAPVSGGELREELGADALADLLEEDLIAERIVIDCYREVGQYLAAVEPAAAGLLESILAVELAHAGELAGMRASLLRRERATAAAAEASLPLLELL